MQPLVCQCLGQHGLIVLIAAGKAFEELAGFGKTPAVVADVSLASRAKRIEGACLNACEGRCIAGLCLSDLDGTRHRSVVDHRRQRQTQGRVVACQPFHDIAYAIALDGIAAIGDTGILADQHRHMSHPIQRGLLRIAA